MTRKHTAAAQEKDPAMRADRLGFRLDRHTKVMIERAAQLEGRKLTEFCITALAETARRTIEQHETLVLSERDRKAFFDVLMNPPQPGERLKRAFAAARHRIGNR
jgi:uncharacterized protein (DUF1778 family)